MYTVAAFEPSRGEMGQAPKTGRRASRGRLIEGARQAVVDRGTRGVTVQHVLDAAGISRRTYYQHFKNVDDVLLAIYEQTTEELVARISGAIAAEPVATRQVQAGVDAFLDHQEQGGTLLILLQAEAVRPDSRLSARREETLDAIVEVLDGAVRVAIGMALHPYVYRTLLMGIEGLVIHIERKGSFDREDREQVGQLMRAMVMATLMSSPHMPKATDT